MDRAEVRKILSAYRPDEADAADPIFSEALQAMAADAELSAWWKEEQIFDRAVAEKVQNIPIAAGLKARLLEERPKVVPVQFQWQRELVLLAAMLAVCAVIFGIWHNRAQPATSLAEYRDEMVSFVRVTPPLDFETSEMPSLLAHLGQAGASRNIAFPAKLSRLEPLGCRALRFRGHDVTLICFNRPDGRRAHLFVMEDGAVPMSAASPARNFAAEGEWMTAAWSEGGRTYLLALQGDQPALEKYFAVSQPLVRPNIYAAFTL